MKKFVVLILDSSTEISSDDCRGGRDRQPGFDNCAFAVRLDFQTAAQLPQPLSHASNANSWSSGRPYFIDRSARIPFPSSSTFR